jgi:PAS domain S-box-containing protein
LKPAALGEDIFPLRGKHGQYRWFLSRARPIRDLQGNVVRWFGTNTDITEQRAVGEALRESRTRLEAALASMTDAVLITDKEGGIATFNDAFAVFHRFKTKENCFKSLADYPALFELLTPEGQVAAVEQWPVSRALRGETTTNAEYILRRKDTGETWFGSYSYGPIRDRDGAVQGAVVAARDITEHKRAEQALRESEERLRLAKAAGQIGIHDFNPVTGELHWDEHLRNLWVLGPDDPVNYEVFLSGLHPMDRPTVDAAVKRALDPQGDGNLYLEYRLIRGDHPRWIAATGHARFVNGRAVRFIGTVQDITQRKEFQAELERLVAERTAKLHELVGELEHFSYSITHDMRAPLRAMRGFAEVLKEMLPDSEQPEMKTFLRHIITSAERMDHLITDALNYSRTVRQDLSLAPVDTHELLEGMLDTYPQFLANRDRLRIQGRLPVVLANESGLTQCFSNLIGNALKFVEPGKDPEVLIRAGQVNKPGGNPDENWVRIWIEDKGIGISPNMLPRLFNMFVRGSNRYEGTGIGLALVRKVVQRMGGNVGVESGSGQGSRFWIELRAPAREINS